MTVLSLPERALRTALTLGFVMALAAQAALATLLGGCAAPAPVVTEARVEASSYLPTFAAARVVLRETDFQIDRVDAYSGVITTKTKTTGGAGTPWDREQSTVAQEFEDLFNRDARVARVTFEPADASARAEAAEGRVDLRDAKGPLIMRVEVTLLRRQRPGWRLQTQAIRASSRASDPELAARGMEPSYDVAIDQDLLLAARIVEEVLDRVRTGAPASGDEPARP